MDFRNGLKRDVGIKPHYGFYGFWSWIDNGFGNQTPTIYSDIKIILKKFLWLNPFLITKSKIIVNRFLKTSLKIHHIFSLKIIQDGKPIMLTFNYEQIESLLETLEILNDPDMAPLLDQAIQEDQNNNIISWEEAQTQLGWS